MNRKENEELQALVEKAESTLQDGTFGEAIWCLIECVKRLIQQREDGQCTGGDSSNSWA